MGRTTGYVEFTLRGLFDTSRFSKINVFQKEIHNKGDARYWGKKNGKPHRLPNDYKFDIVSFSTPERLTDKDIKKDLDMLIGELLPYRDLILDVISSCNAKADFAIVLHSYDEANPETYVEAKTIELVNSFRASLWHDIYSLNDDEDEDEQE